MVDNTFDPHEDDMAAFGDPRRCHRHPEVKTSSADGMHDGLCYKCEAEMDASAMEEHEYWEEQQKKTQA